MANALQHIFFRFRIMPFWVVLLIILYAGPDALAQSPISIPKMPYSQLERMIRQPDGNRLLVFMAAWCRPCKEELPILNRLYHKFQKEDLQFVGISIDSGGPAAMESVLKKKPVDFSVYWVGPTVIEELQLVGIPMIFMIKKGHIIEKIPGKCSYAYLSERISRLIQ